MLKKLLIAQIILLLSTSIAFAKATPYVGVGIGIHNAGGYTGLMENVLGGVSGTFGAHQNYYLAGEMFP